MKLAICVLLSLAALAWADTSYQNYQTYQDNQNSHTNYYEESAPSNYYQSGAPGQRRQGLVDSIRDLFYQGNRRQIGIGGGLLFPIIFIFILFGVGGAIAIFAASSFANINSSGRGLDTDEWEVDHSVWMNQLQKDFEDSWATE